MKLPAAQAALVMIDVRRSLSEPPPEAEDVVARINGFAARACAAMSR